MVIVDFIEYSDGGTIEIKTSEDLTYYVGGRMNRSSGKVYYEYPVVGEEDLYLTPNSNELLQEIVVDLESYHNELYQGIIDWFIRKYKDKEIEINTEIE